MAKENPLMTILTLCKKGLLIILFAQVSLLSAQTKQVAAINNYINFSNECIHGMLIVHRLLENFNQEVNKFVNLESHQINFYSNKDLPQNIFDDPEHWFYDKSPNEWFRICINQGSSVPEKWKNLIEPEIKSMHKTVNEINQLRFDAAHVISSKDLNIRENQEEIYSILENGVALFESFYQKQKMLKVHIEQFALETGINLKNNPDHQSHAVIYRLLEQLRYKDDNDWEVTLARLEELTIKNIDANNATPKMNALLSDCRSFYENAEVDPEYRLYGKYYFFHNSLLLNNVNRYGNGFIIKHNEKINPSEQIKLMEIPHFYQVVYPARWVEDIPLASTDPSIEIIPVKLRNREIVVSDRTIEVDKYVVELELFDHKLIDGDIVSVNFNGDWIIEKHSLEEKPFKLKIKLNEEGKNYLLLHAENLGKRPPNTMALRYTYRGKVETIELSSDLKESEVIEIKYVPENK